MHLGGHSLVTNRGGCEPVDTSQADELLLTGGRHRPVVGVAVCVALGLTAGCGASDPRCMQITLHIDSVVIPATGAKGMELGVTARDEAGVPVSGVLVGLSVASDSSRAVVLIGEGITGPDGAFRVEGRAVEIELPRSRAVVAYHGRPRFGDSPFCQAQDGVPVDRG